MKQKPWNNCNKILKLCVGKIRNFFVGKLLNKIFLKNIMRKKNEKSLE
jgi:hypothetical protein